MVASLLRTHVRRGMGVAEGRRLLGKPETEGRGGGSSGPSDQTDGYSLVFLPVLELPYVVLRFRSTNPYLYMRYENGALVSSEVK
jgi:hypothetical protein